jgi:6-phosphogluconolactonase (cycloisomerase 2 family)
LTAGSRFLLVTNAGSDDVAVFAVDDELRLVQTAPSAGATPVSVTEHNGLVYVLNAGDPSLVGFTLDASGLHQLPGSRRDLAVGADPAQVGFSPDGGTVVVTQRGANSLVVFPVQDSGLLGDPQEIASSGQTPYGFTFADNQTLVVTEAFGAMVGKAAASSYRLTKAGLAPVSRSVGNGRSAICWAVADGSGRFVYATNFADGAVSRYEVNPDGTLTLADAAAGTAIDAHPGLRDDDLSGDGQYLYAIDADARRIFGWRVGPDGRLTSVGSRNGLPASVAGLAAS